MKIPTLRAEPGKFLSREQVLSVAPSVGATKPHTRMSERYAFISTYDVIANLTRNHGFGVVEAGQRRTRRRKPEFTRHFVRLRNKTTKMVSGDTMPEILITNSHDGQTRFTIHGGLFRLVCSNGLVVPLQGVQSASKIHLGDIEEITKETIQVIDQTSKLAKIVERMEKKTLNDAAQAKFAAAAAKLAYDEVNFDTKTLLNARREGDSGNSLWLVFNRVQENIIRGGVEIQASDETHRARTTRGITHIGRNIDINTGLWTLAEKIAA